MKIASPDILAPIQSLFLVVFHVISINGWTQCVGNVSVGSLLLLLQDIWSAYKLGTKGNHPILQLLTLLLLSVLSTLYPVTLG